MQSPQRNQWSVMMLQATKVGFLPFLLHMPMKKTSKVKDTCVETQFWSLFYEQKAGIKKTRSEDLGEPAPSKGCQLNPKGWWIDTWRIDGTIWHPNQASEFGHLFSSFGIPFECQPML